MMAREIEVCPACGALPCDWVNNPLKPAAEQVEKVRRGIFNVLSGEAEPNTGMILAAVYEALGFPGIDYPPASTSTPTV